MPTELSVGLTEPDRQQGIGVVAPFDFALDRELWRWVPDDVSLYLTRLPFFTTPVTVEMAVACGDRRAVRRATRDVLTPEPGAGKDEAEARPRDMSEEAARRLGPALSRSRRKPR